MTYPNIALIGRARSGKDTVAARLVGVYGYTRIAFADPIREMALQIDPYVHSWDFRLSEIVADEGWESAKDRYPEVRPLLQRMGQTVRSYDPDFWLRIALAHAARCAGPVVITDCRFPNEAESLTRAGFETVRIFRPHLPTPDSPHESETALDGFLASSAIRNGGTIDRLNATVDYLVRDLSR